MAALPTDTWNTLPADPTLPGLDILRRPHNREALLRPFLSQEAADLRLNDATIDVRRHAPGRRCVLKLCVPRHSADSGGVPSALHLSIKAYSGDGGARAHETMLDLHRHGFGHGPYRIPKLLGYDTPSAILVSEWVEGCSIRQLLESDRDAFAAVDEAANWLLRLHASGYGGGRVYTWERQAETLETWGMKVSECDSAIGKEYESVLRAVVLRLRSRVGTTARPTHRDFSAEHVFIHGGSATVLDFDEFCQYDPLFDVAHFIVHLRLAALRLHEDLSRFDDLAERFRMHYTRGGGFPTEERLLLYQAVAYLKHAFVASCVVHVEAREEIARTLLAEARRAVAA